MVAQISALVWWLFWCLVGNKAVISYKGTSVSCFLWKVHGKYLAQAREDARAVSGGLCSGVALWESSLFFISYFVSLVSPPSLLTQPKILRPIRENTFNCFPSLPIGKGWWRGGRNGPFLSTACCIFEVTSYLTRWAPFYQYQYGLIPIWRGKLHPFLCSGSNVPGLWMQTFQFGPKDICCTSTALCFKSHKRPCSK